MTRITGLHAVAIKCRIAKYGPCLRHVGEEDVERRLAAIFVVDVVGYSRLMEEDEVGTHAASKSCHQELVRPNIDQHGGRIVKLTGDGALAEFPSAINAVRCAVDIQRGMALRNTGEDKDLQFRIGINVGDAIIEEEDIYGNDVNIASRLEELANPGGICLSQIAFEHVKRGAGLDFQALGAKTVKNLAEPINVYRVRVGPAVSDAASEKKTLWQPAMGLALAAVLSLGAIFWAQPWPRPDETSIQGRPSIVVLPFTNMSGDPNQEYFADGITEDLITDLARISGLFVIARSSSFAYKERHVSMARIGKELGVRYVLVGSVRRAGNKLRINTQLTDAETGGHLWAERYDGSTDDIFALQDKVTRKIVAGLAVNLTAKEIVLRGHVQTTDSLAHDLYLEGWAHYWQNTPHDFAEAIAYFEEALRRDPGYSRVHAALAAVYWAGWDKEWTDALDLSRAEARSRAKRHLDHAMARPSALSLLVASQMLTEQGKHDQAIMEAERAIALEPNNSLSHLAMGMALIYSGRSVEAERFVKMGIRLDPHASEYPFWLALAQFNMERFEAAATTLERVTNRNAENDWPFLLLAATYGHLGRQKEARSALDRFDRMSGMRRTWSSLQLPWSHYWAYKNPRDRARLREGWQRAGVPSHVKIQLQR